MHSINLTLVDLFLVAGEKLTGRRSPNFERSVATLTAPITVSSYRLVNVFMHLHLSIDERQRDSRAPSADLVWSFQLSST